jgi:hypothetical protein
MLIALLAPQLGQPFPSVGWTTTAHAQPAVLANVTVARPTWHLGSGLLYGEITIHNRNPFSLKDVIVSCDFFDEWGNKIGTKATALRRPISPGRTRFSGIEFPSTIRNMQGGACHLLSAERMEGGEAGE